jgi:beta-glucosidase
LYHVDFDTQRRTPKLSASFYRDVIARNALA